MITGIVTAVLGWAGDFLIKRAETRNVREGAQDLRGVEAVRAYLEHQSANSANRADVQKAQGTWGPYGILAAIVGGAFAWHAWQVALDTTPWHLVLTTRLWIVPWIEWKQHAVGSWGVAALPGMFEQTEHAVLQGLFYVGGAVGTVAALARVFRR